MSKAQRLLETLERVTEGVMPFRKTIEIDGIVVTLVAEYYSDSEILRAYFGLGADAVGGRLAGYNVLNPKQVSKILIALSKHIKVVFSKINPDKLDNIVIEDNMAQASTRTSLFNTMTQKIAKETRGAFFKGQQKGSGYVYRVSMI